MTSPQNLLHNLNPQQAEAVTHFGTPLLIVAGAGSGKTRVITHRIAHLAFNVGIPLWEILAVTFTNKAAKEMRERVCRLMGVPDDPSLAIGTFHSRCASILRREAGNIGIERNFAILDERDQIAAVKKAMEDTGIDDKKVKPSQVQHFINLAKMKLLTPKDCLEEMDATEIPYAELYQKYDEILHKNNALDFEDLIFRTVRMFQEHPVIKERWNRKYQYILIDEFQDTNPSQFELAKLLAGEKRQICVVGDEDQSIYSWRGADVKNLLQFKDVYPDSKLIRLEQNYRSVGMVLKAAGAVIANNTMRIGKTLWTEREEGEKVRGVVGMDENDEGILVGRMISGLLASEGVDPSEIAVFYRSHSLSRALEDAFLKLRIPYRIIGGTKFYDRAEIKDILSFMRLAVHPGNDLAFERVANVPTRGAGGKTLQDIALRAQIDGTSQFEAAKEMSAAGEIKGKARTGMAEFTAAIDRWFAMSPTASVTEVLKCILEDTRYKTEGVGDTDSIDGRSRLENVQELENVVKEFEENESDHTVGAFLELMALDAQRDEKDGRPKVSFMTIHNAKGLEFDHVFVVGLEQGVFPNSRTMGNPEQFEEERRLFYVALTRAKVRLTLSRAMRRQRQGFWENTEPSIFLFELPEDVLSESDRRRLGVSQAVAPSTGRTIEYDRPNTGGANRPGTQYSVPTWKRAAPTGASSYGSARNTGYERKAYDVGDRVEHSIMGPGTIVERGGRPGQERVMVEFDDGRSQDFIVKFAPLKKIG